MIYFNNNNNNNNNNIYNSISALARIDSLMQQACF